MGGTFTSQNKIRAGAYINFKAVGLPTTAIGTRGVVVMPIMADWGKEGELIELYSTDLLDGKSIPKIGYSAFDTESLPFRLVLENCYKMYVYRLNTSAVKSTATITDLTITAKHGGVAGNSLTVAVVVNDALFDVSTIYGTTEVDKQTVADIDALVDNDWVTFTGTGSLTANVGTPLIDGTNGTESVDYASFLTACDSVNYNTMAIPQDVSGAMASIEAYINTQRNTHGKKVQAVVYSYDADNEGIISTDGQGFNTATEIVTAELFVAYVGGITAGASITTSNTAKVVNGATSIINPKTESEIEAALILGKFLLSERVDGVVICEKDINTLHIFTVDKSYVFGKNRVIRTLDQIANDVGLKWQTSYQGKVDNNDAGRTLYKGDLIGYFSKLDGLGAIQNFDGSNDVEVEQGEAIDAVVTLANVQPVDSMEKLYMTVNVG